ncbi:MAG: Asp-tRNA(Asn)/Glu-tRNA(Gln) amidotransferase subunit GatC, partial [Myxococcota bacterium]
MSGHINAEEVQRIAKLARLKLDADEVESLTVDIEKILTYVEKLNELKTDDVEPTAHAVPLPTKYREDQVGDELPVEMALANAPERLGD